MNRSSLGRAVALVAAYAVALQALLAAFALPPSRAAMLAALCSDAGANPARPAGSDIAWPCSAHGAVLGRATAFGPQIPRAPPAA